MKRTVEILRIGDGDQEIAGNIYLEDGSLHFDYSAEEYRQLMTNIFNTDNINGFLETESREHDAMAWFEALPFMYHGERLRARFKERLPHSAVGFEHPAKGKEHCKGCFFYFPDGPHCQLVADPIAPEDWCGRFLNPPLDEA